jgi:hypothetical protein
MTARTVFHLRPTNCGGTLGVTPLLQIVTADWTEPITVGPSAGNVSAFFDRSMVISQYVARLARTRGWDTATLKAHIRDHLVVSGIRAASVSTNGA